ncbi:hypothetical protein D9611_004356 [Ephemerocybe angulata]|uniref:NYN domain-containing protein n=1 Tax=Ephemerocybe angulata TaxID=980116 RepID=A0A8H5F6D9_9AGAR|nr:hypothetical protein D9611_004356 [Tulosesus angulatus]
MGHSLKETAIFWDFDSCPAEAESSGFALVDRIRSFSLQFGAIKSFKAYLAVSDYNAAVSNGRALPLRSEMQSSGVSLTDVPGRKDVADRMLIVDMLAYAFERPPSTTTLILITAETAFAYCLSVLRMREYRVVLLTPEQMSTSSLIAQVPIWFAWSPGVVKEESSPPQPQRSKEPTQSRSTHQLRRDTTNECGDVRYEADLVDPTNNTPIKQPFPQPTHKHISETSNFPVSDSVTTEKEVNIEDYLLRKRGASTSAMEDPFHDIPAERHTAYVGNALPPATPEQTSLSPSEMTMPYQQTQLDDAFPFNKLVGQSAFSAQGNGLDHVQRPSSSAPVVSGGPQDDEQSLSSQSDTESVGQPESIEEFPVNYQSPSSKAQGSSSIAAILDRPTVAPHFKVLLSLMKHYNKAGEKSIHAARLASQLPKRQPNVFSEAGCDTARDPVKRYLKAAIKAGILLKDSGRFFSLHPNMAPSFVPSGVPTHYRVLVTFMKEVQATGRWKVTRKTLGEELPKRQANLYAQAGLGSDSDQLEKYLGGAIEIGLLIRISRAYVSLHPSYR